MQEAITSIDNTYVKISWTYPTDNYAAVNEYEILIKKNDGTFIEDT